MRILPLNTWKLRIICIVFTVLYDEDTSLDATRSGIIAARVAINTSSSTGIVIAHSFNFSQN